MDFIDISNIFLWLGAGGAFGFVVIALVEGWTRPDYSPVRQTVSALALGRRGWVQIANFTVSGLMIIAGAAGMLMQRTGAVLAIAILVFGVGLLASAIPMDPMRGYPPGTPEGDPADPSLNNAIHDYAGAVVFFSLPAVALIAVFTLPEWWQKLNAGAMLVILSVALYFFNNAWESDSRRVGLIQRAFIVPGWLWLASVFAISTLG